MDHSVKKGLMIAGIVLITLFIIHQITNASTGTTSTTTTKKVVITDNNPHKYYYGFNEPVHHNAYKAHYYN